MDTETTLTQNPEEQRMLSTPVSIPSLVIAVFVTLVTGMALVSAPAWAGDGRFGGGEEMISGTPRSLAVGDFNSTAGPDLAAAQPQLTGCACSWAGRVEASRLRPTSPVGRAPLVVVVADFNADGKDDLAVTHGTVKCTVRLGTGDGTFKAASAAGYRRLRGSPFSLVVGDFNADGRRTSRSRPT